MAAEHTLTLLGINTNETERVQPSPSLSTFYKTLHEYVTDVGVNEAEVADIQASVEGIVWQFADVVATLEPIFKAKSIHGVGSFYEKTKILKLDEFDFLYVIAELSNDTLVEMERVFIEDVLGVTVKVRDQQYFQDSKWFTDTDESGNSYLGMINFMPAKAAFYVANPQKSFSDVFSEAAATVRSTSLYSKKATGTLTLLGQENKVGPNVELLFEWKPLNGDCFAIKSDITPVIRASNVQAMVTQELCDHPPYLTRLYSTGSYLVMPSKLRHMQIPYTFSPTFTETERDLMRDLNQSHRITYQCLKFLLLDLYTRRSPVLWDLKQFALPDVYRDMEFPKILKKVDYLTNSSFLSSYCLKTAVLLHCRTCDRTDSSEMCGLDVINILLDSANSKIPRLPCTFVNQDNLFWKLAKPENARDLGLLIKVLELLKSFHDRLLKGNYDTLRSPGDNFRNKYAMLTQMSEENGLQQEEFLLEFNPLKLPQGTIYNAYRFTKDTGVILDDTEIAPAEKKLLLDEARLFFNFDLASSNKHSTLASSSIEEDLNKVKEKIDAFQKSSVTGRTETDTLPQVEESEKMSSKEPEGATVIYSRAESLMKEKEVPSKL